ncbi:MAG: hypothetical protein O7G83_16935, partial [Proteobacteria bacterium]|nr:hypothetical protein [Pseudomonadota bacterium]
MPHKVVRRRIFILTALLAAATPIVLASAFAVVAYAPVFGDFRRNLAVRVLSDSLELPIAIDGDVDVVVARSLKLRIPEVRIAGRNRPEGHRARPMNLVELSFPLWPALAGSFEVSELVISGGRLELTGETGSGMSAAGIARLPFGFLNTRVSDHLEFRDFAIHYQDTSGWEFEWTIDMFSSQRSASGERIVLDSQGTLNGLPYSLSGSFANPRADKGDRGREPFELIVDFSGLAAKVGGTLEVFNPVAVLDAQIEVAADSLATLLELLRLEYQTRGKFTLGAKLTGRLDSIRAERIALGFTDAWGRTFELTGGIADLGVGEGIDVVFSAALTGDGQRRGKSAPISEIDVTGFEGKFTGSLDRLVVNQFFLFTNVAAAELNHIGPIDLGQVVRDLDGKLGLLGIRILKGPEDDRIFDFSGEITDVLDLSGIRLAGDFNVSLAGVLMLEPGPRASDLGRLKGVLTLSDAGGSLQLEEFQAAIHGTKLIAFSVRKAESQEGAADSLTLVIDLDIPDFGAVAARLESKARSGPVGFAGDLAFEERRTVLRGEVKIGRTETTVEGRLGFKDDAPFVWADLASD